MVDDNTEENLDALEGVGAQVRSKSVFAVPSGNTPVMSMEPTPQQKLMKAY